MSAKTPTRLEPDEPGIAEAARLLGEGGLVALPTETVYGLAADARNDRAVARIYEAKGRPSFNPLIVHLADLAAVERIAELPGAARDLAAAFWPGPMTLVLPLREGAGLSPLVTAGLPTVALRLPAHPAMRAVLEAFGGPVAAPSANPSGRISATRAEHVIAGLGHRVDAVLDAGPCAVGVESTILAPGETGLRLLREGGLTRENVEAVAGPVTEDVTPGKVEAPGQLSSHYAPGVPVRLGGNAEAEEVSIGFGPGTADLNLSETGDLVEAAAQLFDILHEADALAAARGAGAIRVADVPDEGLGRAINDRLRRAAAPRD